MGCRTCGIHESHIALQFLDHLFVFLVGLDAGNAEGDDFKSPQIPPLCRQLLVQCFCQLRGMAGQGRVADTHLTDSGKSGLKCRQQFGFQLTVNGSAVKIRFHIAADVGVEQQRICHPVRILPKAANGDINVDSRPLVHDPEGYRRGCPILIPYDLLDVKVIHPLILGRLTAKGKALANVLEYLIDTLTQITRENTGFRRGVISKFARFGAHLHYLALLYDHHALAVGHSDHRTVGDNILAALGIGGSFGCSFLSLNCQHIGWNCLTVKILFPLISQHTAGRA